MTAVLLFGGAAGLGVGDEVSLFTGLGEFVTAEEEDSAVVVVLLGGVERGDEVVVAVGTEVTVDAGEADLVEVADDVDALEVRLAERTC